MVSRSASLQAGGMTMARIRTIKPEFWTDERVGECSPTARLLFVATWNFADDEGGIERSAKQLKAQAFPYDQIDCEPLIQELLEAGLLVEYQADGKKYLHIKGFSDHQKIEKKARPRYPVYEESMKCARAPRGLPDSSATSAVSSLGREGKGKGSKKEAEPDFDVNSVAGLDVNAWVEWVAYRKARKDPILPISMLKAATAMAALGPRQRAAVDHTIANGWQGLREPETKPNGHAPPNNDAAWAEAKAFGRSVGFREPTAQESPAGYLTAARLHARPEPLRAPATPLADRIHSMTRSLTK